MDLIDLNQQPTTEPNPNPAPTDNVLNTENNIKPLPNIDQILNNSKPGDIPVNINKPITPIEPNQNNAGQPKEPKKSFFSGWFKKKIKSTDEPNIGPVEQKTEPITPKKKIKVWPIILIIILTLAILGGVYYYFFYNATLTITSQPDSATIDVSGNSAVGSYTAKLKPGTYSIKVELTDYVPYEQSITLQPSKKINLNIDLKALPTPVKLVDYPATFYTTTQDEKSLLYLSNNSSTIYKIDGVLKDAKGIPFPVTPKRFNDVKNILWSPTKILALINQSDKWYLYDFNRYDILNQEIYEWPTEIKSIVWSNDGEKVVYLYQDGNEKTLRRANKDNSSPERIYNLKDVNINNPKMIYSPDSKKILIMDTSLYMFDVYTKTLTQLKQFEQITNAMFSPNSDTIVYDKDGKLYSVDLEGNNKKDLSIATTINKTTWLDSTKLLYFTPTANEQNSHLFSLDLSNNTTTEYIYNLNTPVDVTNPIVSVDTSRIFYNQGTDLYSLKLVEKNY